MLLVFGLMGAAAFAVAILWPPVYRSEAKLIMESQRIPMDLVRPTVFDPGDERLQIIQQRVSARNVILDLVAKFNLLPDERAKLTPTEIVERVLSRVIFERREASTIAQRGRGETLVTLFNVGFEDRSPNTATLVANELVTLVLNEDVKSRTSQAAETTRFIETETEKRRNELLGIEAEISAFKLQNDEALPEKLQLQMAQLENARNELVSLERGIQSLEEQQRLLELELNVRGVAGGGQDVKSPGVREALRQQVDALNAELAVKSSLYRDTHPDIVALKKHIAAIESQESQLPPTVEAAEQSLPEDTSKLGLEAQLLTEKIRTVKVRRATLAKQHDQVAGKVGRLSDVISRTPGVQAKLENLQSRREIVAKGLAELTEKLNAARLGERLERDQQAERLQVIEQPIIPTEPIRPSRPLILLAGIGIAFGGSLAIAMLLEILNRTVRFPNDIESAIGQPPLAIVPYIGTSGERRRAISKRVVLTMIAVALLMSLLVAIHMFYMPLDLAFYKVMRRFDVPI